MKANHNAKRIIKKIGGVVPNISKSKNESKSQHYANKQEEIGGCA